MKNYSFKINGKEYNVAVEPGEDNMLSVNVNGTDYQVELSAQDVPVAAPSVQKALSAPAPAAAQKTAAPTGGAAQTIPSPLPGVIVEVSVKEGQSVKAGQKVAVLEAMKMENEIPAAKDGVITAIHVNKGDSVLEGAPIVSIA